MVVYDYVDAAVPVLARMAAKRQVGYHSLGYAIEAFGGSRPMAAPRPSDGQDALPAMGMPG